ncbi:hypothetical protein LAZ67_3003051 [Cordylochernes scorpioides]|uniref:Uncharacterized protein n=1 Tax=Cordylochernes scorpioides TaxID=51811 RepID=A0ABY6K890_9ARAC|nr:hypothetical protein LAZ67_3003051 [Cordylochernes scorpioides]
MKSLRCLHTSLSQQCSLSWVCKAAVLGPCQFSVVVVVSNEEPQMSPYIYITAMFTILAAVLGPCQFSVVVVVSNEEPQMSPYIYITAMFTILAAVLGPCQFSGVVVSIEESQLYPYISITAISSIFNVLCVHNLTSDDME